MVFKFQIIDGTLGEKLTACLWRYGEEMKSVEDLRGPIFSFVFHFMQFSAKIMLNIVACCFSVWRQAFRLCELWLQQVYPVSTALQSRQQRVLCSTTRVGSTPRYSYQSCGDTCPEFGNVSFKCTLWTFKPTISLKNSSALWNFYCFPINVPFRGMRGDIRNGQNWSCISIKNIQFQPSLRSMNIWILSQQLLLLWKISPNYMYFRSRMSKRLFPVWKVRTHVLRRVSRRTGFNSGKKLLM